MRITVASTARCTPAATWRAQGLRDRRAVFEAQALDRSSAPKPPLRQPFGAEERAVDARAAVRARCRISRNRVAEAVVAADREPLHFVLVGIGCESEQFGDAAVEIAQRIRVSNAPVPASAACPGPAIASRSGNRPRGRASARWPRRTGRRSRPTPHAPGDAPRTTMRLFGKPARSCRWKSPSPGSGRTIATQSTCSGFTPASARHVRDGLLGQTAAVPGRAPPRQLRFFDRRHQFAILQDGAGGIAQDAADSENDQCVTVSTSQSRPASRFWPRCRAAPRCG